MFTPPDGPTFDYDSVAIIPLVEEDGELKILGFYDFADPKKRNYLIERASKGQIA